MKCSKVVNANYDHSQHMNECYKNSVPGIEHVECGLCKFVGCRIMLHVRKNHGLSLKEYTERYGSALAENTKKNISENGNWIVREKAKGNDLSDYRKEMSKAVRAAFIDNEVERTRRSKRLSELNRTPNARMRSSRAAKLTSSRPEIQSKRSDILRAWRLREPEKFQAIVDKMLSYRTSKPEKAALKFVQESFPNFAFKGNQRLMNSKLFVLNKSHKRQIDILSKLHKIIIEIDGWLHFNNVDKWNQLEKIQEKDHELNSFAIKEGYTIIRISYDQWNGKTGELHEAAKEVMKKIISTPSSPQVHFIGDKYQVEKFKESVSDMAERAGMDVLEFVRYAADPKEKTPSPKNFEEFISDWDENVKHILGS